MNNNAVYMYYFALSLNNKRKTKLKGEKLGYTVGKNEKRTLKHKPRSHIYNPMYVLLQLSCENWVLLTSLFCG